jgi:hypothetical protein
MRVLTDPSHETSVESAPTYLEMVILIRSPHHLTNRTAPIFALANPIILNATKRLGEPILSRLQFRNMAKVLSSARSTRTDEMSCFLSRLVFNSGLQEEGIGSEKA